MQGLLDVWEYGKTNKGQIGLAVMMGFYLARSNSRLADIVRGTIMEHLKALATAVKACMAHVKDCTDQMVKLVAALGSQKADMTRTNAAVAELKKQLEHAQTRHDVMVQRDNERAAQVARLSLLVEKDIACQLAMLTHFKVEIPPEALKPIETLELEEIDGGTHTRIKNSGNKPGSNGG